jgi:ribosomal protein S18 acetylase RimI-like enzyme
MEIASLAFRTDLAVLALGGSEITHRDRHVAVRTDADPTYFWGNFVLFADPVGPGETLERLALFSAELPAAAHVAWGIDTVDGTAGAEDELVEAGFHVGRDTVLAATALRAPARPVAAELRPLTGDADWAQALGLHVACADPGDVHVTEEFLAGRVRAARTLCERGHATWFGAFDDGTLVSALGVVSDGSGLARFQAVETHPDARRRGLASALVHCAGETALAHGATTLVIVADPEYYAIGIYRALGFTEAETQVQLTRLPGRDDG